MAQPTERGQGPKKKTLQRPPERLCHRVRRGGIGAFALRTLARRCRQERPPRDDDAGARIWGVVSRKMPMFPPFWGVCSRTEGMPGVPQITNGLAFMVCGNDLNWRPFVQA